MFLPITNYTILFRFWQPCAPICSADVQFPIRPAAGLVPSFPGYPARFSGGYSAPPQSPNLFQIRSPFSGAAVLPRRKPTLFIIIAGSFIRRTFHPAAKPTFFFIIVGSFIRRMLRFPAHAARTSHAAGKSAARTFPQGRQLIFPGSTPVIRLYSPA